jgi:AAA15 family ATPase/GTPase
VLLKIRGIGKINDSTIEMKGITVIAGENNTGKSTFGKVLYCMFNTFHDVDEKIHDARLNDIKRIFLGGLPRFRVDFLGQNTVNDILSGVDIRKAIGEVIKKY